jgi:hypothetical protein
LAAASGGKTFGTSAFVARAAFRFGFAGGLAFGLVAGFAGFGDFVAHLAAGFASGLLAGFTGFFAAGFAFGLLAGFAVFFVVALFADLGLATGFPVLVFDARFTGLAGAFDLPAGLAARALPARGDVFLVLLFAIILISEPHHPARIRAF